MTTNTTTLFRPRLLAAAVAATTAITAIVTPGLSASAADTSQSCWKNADTGETRCFDSSLDPLQQIADDTGTVVMATPTDGQESVRVTPTRTTGVSPASADVSYVILVIYDGTGFSGASYSYFTTLSSGCSNTSFSYAHMESGWDNRVDSFQSFSGCQTALYADTNWGPPVYGPYLSSTNMGSLANTTSSMILN